jgi:hypothetical protein
MPFSSPFALSHTKAWRCARYGLRCFRQALRSISAYPPVRGLQRAFGSHA